MKKISGAIVCILYFGYISNAQTVLEVDSKKIIEKGVQLHDEKKYDEAIAEYKKISKNDTNYILSCVELVFSYMSADKDSLAVVACDEALQKPSAYSPTALLYKGTALEKLKKYDEAKVCFETAMKKYPMNNSVYYEYGVYLYNREKYKEAHEMVVKSIKYNPYHANSHLLMANLAIKQGKLIPAILACQFYLVMDNYSKRAQAVVADLEKLAQIEYEFKDVVKVDGLSELDDFSELESLVRSKIALGAKYKDKSKLNYNITKQLQLISEKIIVNKEDKGFYMQFYAPIIAEQYKNDYFKPYAYFILSGMQIEKIDSWVKKNQKVVDKWTVWLVKYLGENYSTFDLPLNGSVTRARIWYNNSGNKISAVGNKNELGEFIGYWNFYYSNGILKSEGKFDDTHKKDGTWKYYNNAGTLESIERLADGKLTGRSEGFYSNGSKHTSYNYTNSLLDGTQFIYYPTGVDKGKYEYKAGIRNGKETSYHLTGKVEYELSAVNDKYEGAYTTYYDNGHLKSKSFFKDDKRQGKVEEYYNTPANQIKTIANYEQGVVVGNYISYHKNGKTEETGTYDKEGNKTGVWKVFYSDGTIYSETTFSKGKNDGPLKHYSTAGKLTEDILYKNNILQEYKSYDYTGSKIIFQNKKDGKNNYDLVLYHPNGNKRREGKIVDGKNEGIWKDYDLNGFLDNETPYVAGQKQGKYKDYYESGKIKIEMDYEADETNGYYKEYYKNGELKQEGAYIKDKTDGLWTSYYTNGNKKSELFYKDGELDGWQTYYAVNGKLDYEELIELDYYKKRVAYDSTGKKYEEINFDKGTVNYNSKYPNGNKNVTCLYKNNIVQGDNIIYYPNGSIMVSRKYVDGYREGESKYYYLNGKLKTVNNYINGLLHGVQTDYYDDGTIKSKVNYEYDDKVGDAVFYYPNKQIETSYQNKNDIIDGKKYTYDELTGELLIETTYRDNYMISYTYKDKTGKLLAPIEVKNETATIKSYYSNGNASLVYSLKNGNLNGKYQEYYFNGQLKEEENYAAGELFGSSKKYYSSGKLQSEIKYNDGEKNGKSTYYYEDGKIKREEYYLNGEEHGTFKLYDATGKLKATHIYYNGELINVR
jgi:antitoxin component YwqK of YwqJK toxin-antitoxin module